MPCYRPLKGYRARVVNPKTKRRSIVFKASEGLIDMPQDLPCRRCIGCRLEDARQLAMRCCHEASLHEFNSFLTLTYAPEFLPGGFCQECTSFYWKYPKRGERRYQYRYHVKGSLCPTAPSYFVKRLREFLAREYPHLKIKTYGCAEYGEQGLRPHYHLLIFGFDFPDRVPAEKAGDFQLFSSDTLSKLWPVGRARIGEVNFETAGYVARYCTKKISGRDGWFDKKGIYHLGADEHYGRFERERSVCFSQGIGKSWFEAFKSDVYPSDFVVIRGKKMKPPKYYDRLFELDFPSEFSRVKSVRRFRAKAASDSCDDPRLAVREEFQHLKFKQLKRGYENDS